MSIASRFVSVFARIELALVKAFCTCCSPLVPSAQTPRPPGSRNCALKTTKFVSAGRASTTAALRFDVAFAVLSNTVAI